MAMAQWSSHWNEWWCWKWSCACCFGRHLTLECWADQKCMKGKRKRGCRPENGVGRFVKWVWKKKVKKKRDIFFKPTQNEIVAGDWPTQSQWMNCPPSKTGLVQSLGLIHSSCALVGAGSLWLKFCSFSLMVLMCR
jgi:hypothetical protein